MKNLFYSLMLITALFLTGCANAGKDQKVQSEASVQLDASKSTASVGGKLKRYYWKQVRGPSVALSNKRAIHTSFVAPTVTKPTALFFKLTTLEFGGKISPFRTRDYISITVEPNTTTNQAPNAVASVSQSTVKEGNSVTFDASTSHDSDGQITAYSWKDENGVELSTEVTFTHVFTETGTHTVTLTVTDNENATATTSLNVQVNALVKPLAIIHTDTTVIRVNDSVVFDASSSSDADGEIVTYRWLDAEGNILSNDVNFTYTFTTSGEQNITLEVMDDDEQIVSAHTTITVEAILQSTFISSETDTLIVDDTLQLSATGSYNDDSTLDITSSAAWTSSDESVATVDANGTVTAVGVGSTNIVATVAGISSNAIVLTVELPADTQKPVIDLHGGDVTLTVGDTYTELATANDNKDGDITANIVITGSVDTNTVGTYTLTYDVNDSAGNAADTVTRTVRVVALVMGTVTGAVFEDINENMIQDLGETDTNGITIIITDSQGMQYTVVTNNGYYTLDIPIGVAVIAVDMSSLPANAFVTTNNPVNILVSEGSNNAPVFGWTAPDVIKPVIDLHGGDVTLTVGDTYTELATANDNKDGDITANIVITGSVDTNTVGTYTLTYDVNDSAGNAADTVTRTVTVVENTTVPVVDANFSIDLAQVPGYSANDSIEDQYLSVVNYLRGLRIKCNDPDALEGPVGSDLVWNTFLTDSSQEHSDDMLTTGQFTHEGSGTQSDITGQTFTPVKASSPFERMKYNGYNYTRAGENIAWRAKYPTLSATAWVQAMEDWMKSHAGHCSNIMNPNFRDFGMAEAKGPYSFDGLTGENAYWTQNFGAQ